MPDNTPTKVTDKVVVTIEYTMTVEGEVLDSSDEEGPLEYLQGFQNVIPGLESAMLGMKVGESKSIVVSAEEGYGEFEEDSIMKVPRDEFPPEIPVEKGVELHMTDQDGDTFMATVVEVGEKSVQLDTNHPLAGKELHFDVKVTDLRTAAPEEIDHGHVHSGGHHH